MTAPANSQGRIDSPAPAPAVPATERRRVVVVGNPNVGKTTVFNALTGQHARVGNYPGVTVELRIGELRVGRRVAEPTVELIDIPGAYSLSSRSAEEQIALSAILGLAGNPRPELAVVVVDAGQLVRNLYLVLQLIELEVPVVIALNMIDEVADNPPDAEAIERLLGVACVPTCARDGGGIRALEQAIVRALDEPTLGRVEIRYPAAIRPDVDAVAEALPPAWRSTVERDRALSRWALMSIEEDDELVGIEPRLRQRCREVQERAEASGRDLDREIIASRYAFLDQHAPALYAKGPVAPATHHLSDKVDRVLIHPVFGFGIFLGIMLILFQSLFTWSDPAIGLIEDLVGLLQSGAVSALPAGLLRDLLVEGVLGGVGNVVVFLPQILLLFFFIGILEDSGYMARVAYLMDRVMRSLGLHGRAFVPMLSGFACAIPAILATRTMERRRDRLLTMMVVPLMTCSARLPVYTLIIAALFPPSAVFGWVPVQGLLMVAMYVFATVVALISAAVLGRTAIRGRQIPLVLELPPYRLPRLDATVRMMWQRARTFLTEAGTVILACTIVLWGLLSFPRISEADTAQPQGSTETTAVRTTTDPLALSATEIDAGGAPDEAGLAQRQLQNSFAGRLGRAIEPAIAPLGFDWKIGVGIIGAFAAREVFVSTMGIVYGVGDSDEDVEPLRQRMREDMRDDGRPVYTPLVGLSLMVFFALACQCMSTLAVVRRETRSWRWPGFLFAYMTTLAYAASFAVYQGGQLLGF